MVGSEQPQKSNDIFLFLGLATVLSALMWFLIFAPTPIKGGGGGHYVEALMWCPALAAILSLLIKDLPFAGLGLGRFAGKYALAGYLIPLGYAAIAYLAVWSLGLGGLSQHGGRRQACCTGGLAR